MSDPSLDVVFGKESRGETPEERARSSDATFVRSQHQISRWTEGAKGRVVNAVEALDLFGWEVLQDLATRPSSPFVRKGAEAGSAILKQIKNLGVEDRKVFDIAKLSATEIKNLRLGRQVPFRKLERLAQSISLDPDTLGIRYDAGADHELGLRLRTLAYNKKRLTPSVVLALAEAAWVINKQAFLSEKLGETQTQEKFRANPDYGNKISPAYVMGFRLALETRRLLGIGPYEPIDSMTQLIESRLKIPVVYVSLPGAFAGATLSNGNVRGIVVNEYGGPELVWMRRMTMAHELGHLLWDPIERLDKLVVDRRKDIEVDFVNRVDPVEQRANAFAVEFLAPRDEIVKIHGRESDDKSAVETVINEYGIGIAATIYHLKNRLHNTSLNPGHIAIRPDPSLIGREKASVDIFHPSEVPISRRGRFATLVGKAVRANLISKDTAGAMLGCPLEKTETALDWVARLE